MPAPALVSVLLIPLLFARVSLSVAVWSAWVTVTVEARSVERNSDPAPLLVMTQSETSKLSLSKMFAVVTLIDSGSPELPLKTALEFWVQTTAPGDQFSLSGAVLQLSVGPAEFQVSWAWATPPVSESAVARVASRAAKVAESAGILGFIEGS